MEHPFLVTTLPGSRLAKESMLFFLATVGAPMGGAGGQTAVASNDDTPGSTRREFLRILEIWMAEGLGDLRRRGIFCSGECSKKGKRLAEYVSASEC